MRPRTPGRGRWWWLPALAGGLAVVLVSAGGRPAPPLAVAAGEADHWTYLPQVLKPLEYLYLPLAYHDALPYIRFVNQSFEDRNWYTDYSHGGNQWPFGWTFRSTENGEVMPFPTKHQEGSIVPAIAGGWGEYVHKLAEQLPTDEQRGAVRGLIIDQWTTYKAFSAAIPQALSLSQVLTGTPGATMQVTGYILGETFDTPKQGNPSLEADHFIASVQLGAAADTRTYAAMQTHLDVPGNVRHWNKFVVSALVPPGGQLLLKIIVQQNWAGRTDFFIDAFSAVQSH